MCGSLRTPAQALRALACAICSQFEQQQGVNDWRKQSMGRGILLWLLGVPIPIILLALIWH